MPLAAGLRTPGAGALIYGGMEVKGIAFEGVEQALVITGADLPLFGKPVA